MAASAILDLLYACLYHPRRAFGSLYHYAKFGCNQYSSFDDMLILLFYELGLKMRFLGIWHPNGTSLIATLQGTSWRGNTSYDLLLVTIGPPVRARGKPKNKVKNKGVSRNRNHNMWHFHRDHPHCRSTWWICIRSHTRDVVTYTVSQKRIPPNHQR